MKKMMAVLAVAVLSVVAQANLLTNGEFDDGGTGWGCNGSGTDWSKRAGSSGAARYRADDGVNICALGWWDNASIWAQSNAVIQENTVYTLTVKARTAIGGGEDWGDGVFMTMQDASNGWANIVANTSFLFPDGDNADAQSGIGPWRTFSISFDSASTPTLVGHTIGVGIRLDDNNARAGWGAQYGWTYIDSVTLVPEPATLVLLGLGALVLRKNRK